MAYQVELSTVAERVYLDLYSQAQGLIEAGVTNHPAVLTFNAVQHAISTTLTINPFNPGETLAGVFFPIFSLSLGAVWLTYLINVPNPTIIVLTISRTCWDERTKRMLNKAIDKGDVDPLLDHLGIKRPCPTIVATGVH